ncbi:hypothetical protein OG539_37295 [Actinacidiphila glaucinigra]|uniref:hypothetical protein n=1 Tax=Actinacidiphila glaucinigra TaxID=235986 RepID=UPI00324FAEAD
MAEMTGRRRWAAAVVLVGVAGVLILGAWTGQRERRRSGGLLLAARLLDHPMVFAVAVGATLTAALLLAVRGAILRSLILVAGVFGTLVVTPAAGLFGFPGGRETMRAGAPDRPDRHLVVEEGGAMIDPLWWVYVDDGSGLTTRRWHVGFVNGDYYALRAAEWDGPDRVRLTVDTGERDEVHVVGLSPSDGRPHRMVDRG